jgi:hypothetical protein
MSFALAIPEMNITAQRGHPERASWSVPLIPWPLLQPPARRAPQRMKTPPTNAPTIRFPGLGPKCSRLTLAAVSLRKVPPSIALNIVPAKAARRNTVLYPKAGFVDDQWAFADTASLPVIIEASHPDSCEISVDMPSGLSTTRKTRMLRIPIPMPEAYGNHARRQRGFSTVVEDAVEVEFIVVSGSK